jgi:sRNA-binding regulator protein Hfq
MKKQIIQEPSAQTSIAVLEPTPAPVQAAESKPLAPPRKRRFSAQANAPVRFAAMQLDDDSANRQAELFYLQKQIQLQTPMIFILEDGERVQGIVEWYDRHSIKVRGKSRVLVYKSAIKYLYKAGEIGSAPVK